MIAQRVFDSDARGFTLTARGVRWFEERDISPDALAHQRRTLCRPCLDWGERRHHLAGALGAALVERCFRLRWARRAPDSRVVRFTPQGERQFRALFAA